jgi:hypothetical protein
MYCLDSSGVERLLYTERVRGSKPCPGTKHTGVTMSKSEDTLNRAYGHIAKEVTPIIEINLFPTWRGIKYYYIMLKRKLRV